MIFKDELAEIIQSARDVKRQRQKTLSDARNWWNDFTEKEVRPILGDATAALKDAGVFSLQGRKNGDTVYISVGPREKDPEHSLSFRFDSEKGSVACQSSERHLGEEYEIGTLTADKVRDKVRDFVRTVIENYI